MLCLRRSRSVLTRILSGTQPSTAMIGRLPEPTKALRRGACRLLRQVAGLLALENLVDVTADPAINIRQVGAVACEPADLDEFFGSATHKLS